MPIGTLINSYIFFLQSSLIFAFAAAVIEDSIIAMHGGLSPDIKDLEDVTYNHT